MSDATTKPSGYPVFFNLLLIVIVPIGFVTATLAVLAALPIGELGFRLAVSAAIALVPLVLALRASAALRRRRVRGLLRAPIAIALILLGYAATVGGLHRWRGLRPPELVAAADHLHRVYLLGESPPPLAVSEPKLPLPEVYDRRLPNLSADEHQLVRSSKPGISGIEIWSTKGDFRRRFIGPAAIADRLLFLDDHRLLAVRSTGRAVLLDAKKGELIRSIETPEPLAEVRVETSTSALIIAGKHESSGETVIHYFDLETGVLRASLRSKTYVTFGVTSDLRRVLIVDRGRRNQMMLVAHHLPSGELEANIPKAVLVNGRGRKLKSVTQLVAIGGGEQALVFDGTTALAWDVLKKKPLPFALSKAKLYPYGVAPGGYAYFHRRTDAGDPNPTGLYRLPSGEKILELPTRGQPPRAFFSRDGGSVAIGPVVFSTADGGVIGGRMPESFTLDREHFVVPASDGSAFLEPGKGEHLAALDSKRSKIGVVPKRGEEPGAISTGGELHAAVVVYPTDRWLAVLEDLDRWSPEDGAARADAAHP